jgi:hypothetical protein
MDASGIVCSVCRPRCCGPPAGCPQQVVEPSDPGYARLSKIVSENNGDRYIPYQKATSRPIPVVAITPV